MHSVIFDMLIYRNDATYTHIQDSNTYTRYKELFVSSLTKNRRKTWRYQQSYYSTNDPPTCW